MQKKGAFKKRNVFAIGAFVAVYVLLSNARSVTPNPLYPAMDLDISIIVPILAGIFFSSHIGFMTGVLSPFANLFTPAGGVHSIAALVPYGLVGFLAGHYTDKIPSPVLALLVIPANLLKMLCLAAVSIVPFSIFQVLDFWLALAYETFFEIIAVIVISAIYRLGFR